MTHYISHTPWLRWTLLPVLVLGLLGAATAWSPAAESSTAKFVGKLALALDQADRLQLSDETQTQLKQLVEARIKAAVPLLDLKDLPPAEQARRLAPFVEESEQMGMKLLTIEQRSKLDQLHLQRAGMASLGDPDMAQKLELSEEQAREIQRLLGQRALEMTRGGETEQQRTQSDFERQCARS